MESAMAQERVVAVGLLTQRDVDVLGHSFTRLWPVDETPCFVGLLEAIDEADGELWRERDASNSQFLERAEKEGFTVADSKACKTPPLPFTGR
jgi:hypothetical protein